MLVIILVGIGVEFVAPPCETRSSDVGDPNSVETAGPPKESTSAKNERDKTERRRNVASILMMLLVGVGLIGVAMIAAALMWGAKLRRLARESVPGPTQRDELWYLKTPPPPDDGGTSHPPSLTGNQPSFPTTEGRPTTNGDTST